MAQARPLSSTIFFSRGGKGCLTDWSGVLDVESNATLQFTLHYSTSASKPPQFSSFPAVFLLPARHGDIGEGQKPPAKREAMSRNKLNWQPTAQGTNSTERAEERHSRAIILTGGVTERLPTPAALRAQGAPRGSAAAAAQPRAALRSAAPPARGFSAPRAARAAQRPGSARQPQRASRREARRNATASGASPSPWPAPGAAGSKGSFPPPGCSPHDDPLALHIHLIQGELVGERHGYRKSPLPSVPYRRRPRSAAPPVRAAATPAVSSAPAADWTHAARDVLLLDELPARQLSARPR